MIDGSVVSVNAFASSPPSHVNAIIPESHASVMKHICVNVLSKLHAFSSACLTYVQVKEIPSGMGFS